MCMNSAPVRPAATFGLAMGGRGATKVGNVDGERHESVKQGDAQPQDRMCATLQRENDLIRGENGWPLLNPPSK